MAAISLLSFRFNAAGDGTCVFAVGTLRNDSKEIAADDVYIEVQYFDAKGTLLDTEGAEQYGLTLLPLIYYPPQPPWS